MIEGYQNIKNKKFIYNEYYIIHDDIIIFFSYSTYFNRIIILRLYLLTKYSLQNNNNDLEKS